MFSNALRWFNTLVLDAPDHSLWATLIIWVIRVVTILVILRNYIAPYILELASGHIRVRSISLRSIRGIYIRRGVRTWRIDRIGISYRSASGEGTSRFTVKIEGLKLEIGRTEHVPPKPPPSGRHHRGLTLADLSPSPLAFRIWTIISSIYAFLELELRPTIRFVTVACLRLFIRCLPALTQALHFDLNSAEVTFSASPHTSLRIKEATLHTQLDFTHLEDVMFAEGDEHRAVSRPPVRSVAMAVLKARLAKSFERTWEKAWGKTQGAASIALTVKEISGLTSQSLQNGPASGIPSETFLSLPGNINCNISLRFSPSKGTVDRHSLTVDLNVDSVHVSLDPLRSLLSLLKDDHQSEPTHSPRELPPSTFPSSASDTLSAKTPMSPFIEALRSASRRSRASTRPAMPKLKDSKPLSWLSALMSINVQLSTLSLTAKSNFKDNYEVFVKEVAFDGGLSNPDQNAIHRQYLGRNHIDDGLSAEVYAFNISTNSICLDRAEIEGQGRLRVLSVSSVQLQTMVSQWPSPWLAPSPFLSGDPNAPLLVIQIVVGSTELTERFEVLQRLVADAKPSGSSLGASPLLPSILSPVPRIAIAVEFGSFLGRLICSDSGGTKHFAMEARTDGFIFTADSNFFTGSYAAHRHDFENAFPDRIPLQMVIGLSFVSEPTFIRVRSDYHSGGHRFSKFGTTESDSYGDPILCLESVEVMGQATAIGDVKDDMESTVSLDTSSIVWDLHCSTDAISIEVWHPNVVMALTKLLSLAGPRLNNTVPTSPPSCLLDKLPAGLSLTLSWARFILFVTGPDLNPNEDMEITRGLALRTGLSTHYSALRSSHVHAFSSLPVESQTRQKLYLPEQRIIAAVATAKSSAVTHEVQVFCQVNLWDSALRSAAATKYVADDPHIAERDDPTLKPQEFVQVPNLKIDINLSGVRGRSAADDAKEQCQLILHIPYVRGTFQLVHVYSLLLAARTVKSLLRDRERFGPSPIQKAPSTMSFQLQATIKTIQVFWSLPKQTFANRIDSINAHYSSNGQIGLGWSSFLLWVPIPPGINKWDDSTEDTWEELLRLQKWTISLPPSSASAPVILVEGDSARLRIPFGFVLAHLILDVTVTMKCLRHLTKMIAADCYSDIPSPTAEAAKAVPNLTISIQCLFVEFADDPFEAKLGRIWRAGFGACRQRLDREDAFNAKVAAILAAEAQAPLPSARASDSDYHFSPSHSVSVEDARVRLAMVHAVDWTLRVREEGEKCSRKERALKQRLLGQKVVKGAFNVPNIVTVTAAKDDPPLFRAVLRNLLLKISKPSFPSGTLSDFLHEQGHGLPHDTEFSLLLPMHLNLSLSSMRMCLRDYPIPLLDIRENLKKGVPELEFDTNLVIAEEMGTALSVNWIECQVVGLHSDIGGAKPMSISVPKTMMPVKTYASPIINVTANNVTSLAWGVSYGAATQDLTRVLETLSTPPCDSSPNLGFWDKMRLIFHWNIKVSFTNEVRLHLTGTRDPCNIINTGAGFALCWKGHPTLLIGYENPDRELVQMISDSALIVIPDLVEVDGQTTFSTGTSRLGSSSSARQDYQKICAKFSSGVRVGVGFVPERSCGTECAACTGSAFERKCRFFDFRSHFDVKLENKGSQSPIIKSSEDSYNCFRSDFIHLSVSLTSSLKPPELGKPRSASSLHLSPKTFAHFWSWWSLFDGVMSLPIRQGSFYPQRIISPKLGRHIATLKYRISVAQLFISHVYIDDSRESWVDGVTPFVGTKAMISQFQADMHQRDQESILPGKVPDAIKVVRHKPFYAAEVVLNGLDLRTIMAIFIEPLKQTVNVASSGQRSSYRMRDDLPIVESSSPWFDIDDFVETDWLPPITPTLHLLPTVACSRLTYFKRNCTSSESPVVTSKFGVESSHSCLLGKESSVSQIQLTLASERIDELRQELKSQHRQRRRRSGASGSAEEHFDEQMSHERALEKKISLLNDYITQLQEIDTSSHTHTIGEQTYYMPSDTVSPDEWSEFDNVYQVHCPRIFMNNAIRDILMQYYHCSRGWRGLEYHMATRAVKFIRDQAGAIISASISNEAGKPKGQTGSAQAAALALRRILIGDGGPDTDAQVSEGHLPQEPDLVDPLSGWSEGVSLRRSHFCLLLKPQIVLRSDTSLDSVCVLAAVHAKLQSFGIMDDSNVEDPISGQIMTRSYTSLNGLQTFSPTSTEYSGNGCVPLEVLIDYRCESNDFDRLVPQTDATFHYDKFNRLRLRNNVTSVNRTSLAETSHLQHSHLHNETDLVRIHVPRFTISASDRHFQDISNIVTGLILFSDAAHKTHMERLETLVFAYDFTDLSAAANVVADLQCRLRSAMETKLEAEMRFHATGYEGTAEILKLKAHIFLLAEELNLLFDAIKLAQDRTEDETDQKSALLLNASASEISWKMLDEQRDLLSKLAMRNIDYSWLSRQDSSTVNKLAIGDLQAYDGSPRAVWPEILSKYHEPSNHPLLKRELFLLADWTVLAPVGGITIYETFELSLHPMRLQVDAKVGSRIMEYVWPARKQRTLAIQERTNSEGSGQTAMNESIPTTQLSSRKSLDSPRALEKPRTSLDTNGLKPPGLRRLATSRSFTDLRSSSAGSGSVPPTPLTAVSHKSRATDVFRSVSNSSEVSDSQGRRRNETTKQLDRKIGDAAEMKTRSSQKTFILVKISSLHLLLSIVKEQSFDLRDARITTRDLEYRNQTWSFEELVDQFIPADMTWKGWIKMAFHQPLVPVLPVARELFSKTKWIASKSVPNIDAQTPLKTPKLLRAKREDEKPPPSDSQSQSQRRLRKKSLRRTRPSDLVLPSFMDDGDAHSDNINEREPRLPKTASHLLSMFRHRSSSRPRSAVPSQGSSDSISHRHRSDTISRSSPERPRK